MKKRDFIKSMVLAAALCVSLTACVSSSSNNNNNDSHDAGYEKADDYEETDGYEKTDDYADDENERDNDDTYYSVNDDKRSSVLTDANDYESGDGTSSEVYYASINDDVKKVFGLTYGQIESQPDYYAPVLYTFDESPDRYGMEYQNNRNCAYIFHKKGDEPCGEHDICVGACGWFSRLMDFEHEWAAYVYDLESALKETYPDCSDVKYVSTSTIPDAPTNISDTLAYMDFTATFDNTEPTKVRLYVEASDSSSIVDSDDWTLICLPEEY